LILIKEAAVRAGHCSPMVTRFPPGAQPHKPAAQPAPAPAPKVAEEAIKVDDKDHACACGGKCGGAGKAKN